MIISKLKDEDIDWIHDWFELTYAQYLAIPRSVLQTMPKLWQKKFVECLNELDDTIDWRRDGCYVKFKDNRGRWMRDELCAYRHVNYTPNDIKEIVKRHNVYYKQNDNK